MKSFFPSCLLMVAVSCPIHAQDQHIQLDTDFPGGNIIVDGNTSNSTLYYTITGDTVRVRPDLRDTRRDWFYWAFRITGAAGRTLTFQFPERKIGAYGPAYSDDGGESWRWLFDELRKNTESFSYSFGYDQDSILFSMGMSYLQADFDAFITDFKGNRHLKMDTLAISERGRMVEKLLIHDFQKPVKYKVLIAARHHACEMMASYVLEGVITAALSDDNEMKWLRENVEIMIVPFMDKDGVQDGDQGKGRRPRDHNRDYIGTSLYATTRAIRAQVPGWAEGKLRIGLDLHCPGLTGEGHEYIHLVGSKEKSIQAEQIRFARIIEEQQAGDLNFQADFFLKFGTSWNIGDSFIEGMTFKQYIATIDGVSLPCSIEFPYANNSGQEVTAANARLFGHDVAKAIMVYLRGLEE